MFYKEMTEKRNKLVYHECNYIITQLLREVKGQYYNCS